MLGESAGRSAGNSPRRTARRKFDEVERLQNTPLLDDPDYWGEEAPPLKPRMLWYMHDSIAAFCGATFALLLLAIAEFSGGWVARVMFGILITYVSILSILASHPRSRRAS